MKSTTTIFAIGGLAAALTLSACSNPLEDATNGLIEGAAEKALEAGSGGDADIDLNLDGDGADLPDGWPDGLPVPDGTIQQSSNIEGTLTISMLVEDSAVLDDLDAKLTGAGYALNEDASASLGSGEDDLLESRMYSGNGHDVIVGLVGAPGEYFFSMTVVPSDGDDEPVESDAADDTAMDDSSDESMEDSTDDSASDGGDDFTFGEGVPDSWPDEIPVPDGEVIEGFGTDGEWYLVVSLDGPEGMDEHGLSMVAEGFTVVEGSSVDLELGEGEVSRLREYTNGTYRVAMVYAGTNEEYLLNTIVTIEE
ncbi:hypothetical protein [Demequina flava]|uniref:hypothetical protein n=1 Tax=Demequina flava TaxID=1095025 RepID=UPI0007831DCD|nr:hypothetical protein [Demequina flava]